MRSGLRREETGGQRLSRFAMHRMPQHDPHDRLGPLAQANRTLHWPAQVFLRAAHQAVDAGREGAAEMPT